MPADMRAATADQLYRAIDKAMQETPGLPAAELATRVFERLVPIKWLPGAYAGR